jgi:hypothetical protein
VGTETCQLDLTKRKTRAGKDMRRSTGSPNFVTYAKRHQHEKMYENYDDASGVSIYVKIDCHRFCQCTTFHCLSVIKRGLSGFLPVLSQPKLQIRVRYVRSEVFTAVTMKRVVFWDVTPCGSRKN